MVYSLWLIVFGKIHKVNFHYLLEKFVSQIFTLNYKLLALSHKQTKLYMQFGSTYIKNCKAIFTRQ